MIPNGIQHQAMPRSIVQLGPAAVGPAAQTLFPEDSMRKEIFIVNTTANAINLGGNWVSSTNYAVQIPGNGSWSNRHSAGAAWFGYSGGIGTTVIGGLAR
jgi:hypothetical protein